MLTGVSKGEQEMILFAFFLCVNNTHVGDDVVGRGVLTAPRVCLSAMVGNANPSVTS